MPEGAQCSVRRKVPTMLQVLFPIQCICSRKIYLRFEHGDVKLFSFPGSHLTSVRRCCMVEKWCRAHPSSFFPLPAPRHKLGWKCCVWLHNIFLTLVAYIVAQHIPRSHFAQSHPNIRIIVNIGAFRTENFRLQWIYKFSCGKSVKLTRGYKCRNFKNSAWSDRNPKIYINIRSETNLQIPDPKLV